MRSTTLARGGVIIHPVLENGQKKKLHFFVDINMEMAIERALAKLMHILPDGKLLISDPSYTALADRFISNVLMAMSFDYAAMMIAAAEGVIPVEQCIRASLTQVDKEKMATALAASLSQRDDYTKEEWKKLNDAETSSEVQEAAKAFIPASLLWPQCLGCRYAPPTDIPDVN